MSYLDLAAQSRELAGNDFAETPLMRRGSPLDRNTELLLPAPFDLATITDAALEAQHVTDRARRRPRRPGAPVKRLIGALCTVVVLTGCSQTAALAPVGGDRLAEVRFAALDVLTALEVQVLVAPVCTASGPDDAAITCVGTTVDEQTIAVSSTADDQEHFEVLVGGESVFQGVVLDVLDAAARPPS